MNIIIDIETSALPEAELEALLPAFNPAEVKTGNIKDPEKLAAKIAEAEASQRRQFFEDAALDALTGRVLVFGIIENGIFGYWAHEDEKKLLEAFWQCSRDLQGNPNTLVGFNIHLFDLPFLMRRSWKHGIRVPSNLRKGRWWGDWTIDLRESWQLGDRQAHGSLDSISRHLGIGAKTGSGKDFAELWKKDQKSAIAYLKNDLELTARMAKIMGVL